MKPARRTKLTLWLSACALLAFAVGFEAFRAYTFYDDLSAARDALHRLESRLELDSLGTSEAELQAHRAELIQAGERLQAARKFIDDDPLVFGARQLPWLGKQAEALRTLVGAAEESANAGLLALDVGVAFQRYEPAPESTSLEGALQFMSSQEETMSELRRRLDALQARRDRLPGGLVGPLESASRDFGRALEKLDSLVEGYEQANTLLPAMLGDGEPRTYLLLLQNDTELFPSGGLISSYGLVTFEEGRLTDFEVEYFGVLYDRWQRESGGEYVEPPAPLKQYLLRHFSWALGEAGWYPDFPTTARLANDFVLKGGAPETDSVVAIDIQFTSALLSLLGPVQVPEYEVTVSAENLAEVTLEYTRDDHYVPGEPKKAFLSYLAREVLKEVFRAPKEEWPEMLRLLGRMGQERHLQLHFDAPSLQALSADYGFDGALNRDARGDFLLIADTSVNSTKLNLILEPAAHLQVTLQPEGSTFSRLTYRVANPYSEWSDGRDAELVRQLMGHGVYGSYLRAYVPAGSSLLEVTLNGESAGAEQIGVEFGRAVFGRFFAVLPDHSSQLEMTYQAPAAVLMQGDGVSVYSLLLQKQAGTDAVPITVEVRLPPGARLLGSQLDGKAVDALVFDTDLGVDRLIEVRYQVR